MQIVHGLHGFILSTSNEGQEGEIKSALVERNYVLFYLIIVLRLGNQSDFKYSVKSFNFSIRCIWITLLAFALQIPLVLSCGKFFFKIFPEFWTYHSRYNLWHSAERNRSISSPVASISTETYLFLTLVTRTQYFT